MKGLQKFGRSEYRNVGKYQKELKTTKPYPIQKKKDNFLLQVKKTSLTNFIQKSIFEYIHRQFSKLFKFAEQKFSYFVYKINFPIFMKPNYVALLLFRICNFVSI
jgi:hypothetical protein